MEDSRANNDDKIRDPTDDRKVDPLEPQAAAGAISEILLDAEIETERQDAITIYRERALGQRAKRAVQPSRRSACSARPGAGSSLRATRDNGRRRSPSGSWGHLPLWFAKVPFHRSTSAFDKTNGGSPSNHVGVKNGRRRQRSARWAIGESKLKIRRVPMAEDYP